jgi:3',5'-cyclic AMP phosphodiesterase CpdA
VIVQLSDPHIGAEWAPGDPVAGLAAAVRTVRELELRPEAVLVSGDLADHATDEEYAQARELLERIGAPLHVLPGNHDRRAALRRTFDVPGKADEPVRYAVDLDGLRLVVLDTTRPGEDRGELDEARLRWLDDALSAAPDVPALVAMHHPPLVTGFAGWDAVGLPDGDRAGLAAVLGRHPNVVRLTAGHLHRTIAGAFAGRAVLAAPSTYVQMRFDPAAGKVTTVDEPAGFAIHELVDGALLSHLQPVA